jgi:hypothetical protein
MIVDNLTVFAVIWAVITIGIVLKLVCNGCHARKLLGRSCNK